MFTIDTNQTIRINRGDDSGNFTLFVNKGTTINPIRHEFAYGIDIISTPDQLSVTIDETTWKSKITDDGVYTFTYKYTQIEGEWVYNWFNDAGEIVTLSDYGITYEGTPAADDVIIISQVLTTEEIYLYVYRINDIKEHFIFKKTFITDGTVETINHNKASRQTTDNDLISNDGDMKLFIDSEDTNQVCDGEYRYVIIAKLYDIDKKKYYINTITNEHKFYILKTGYGIN